MLGFMVKSLNLGYGYEEKGKRSWNTFTRRKWLESLLEGKIINFFYKPKFFY